MLILFPRDVNMSPHSDLISSNKLNTPVTDSGLAPRSCIFLLATFFNASSILPYVNLPPAAKSGVPDNNASFKDFIKSVLLLIVAFSYIGFKKGNIPSMCLSTPLDISDARFTSPALTPIDSLSSLKNSSGLSPRGLTLDNILSIKSLFDSSSLRLLIMLFIAEPEPPTRPSSSELSKPNFSLFIISRAALFSLFGFNCVGPKSNASPSVPTFSGSPTNIASATPIPAAPPSVAYNLPFAFNVSSIFGPSLGSDALKYLSLFLENIAFFARPVPTFHACEPGIPRFVMIRAI